MTDSILNFFSDLGGGNVAIITMIVAMIPVIELKGAIPFAASTQFWGEYAISVWEAYLYAFIGTSLIAITLILLYKQLLKLMFKWKLTQNFAKRITLDLTTQKNGIDNQVKQAKINKRVATALTICAIVATPIPLTGVWTCACLCTVLQMPVLDSILCVVTGNAICGLIIAIISYKFAAYTHIILLAILILAILLFIYKVVFKFIKKMLKQKNNTSTEDIVLDSAKDN